MLSPYNILLERFIKIIIHSPTSSYVTLSFNQFMKTKFRFTGFISNVHILMRPYTPHTIQSIHIYMAYKNIIPY